METLAHEPANGDEAVQQRLVDVDSFPSGSLSATA